MDISYPDLDAMLHMGGNVVATGARIDDALLRLSPPELSAVWRCALMLPSLARCAYGSAREVRTRKGCHLKAITRRPCPIDADGELQMRTPAAFAQPVRAPGVRVPGSCPLPLRSGGRA